MPNHVTNKLVFQADRAAEVFAAVCPNDRFSFEALIPPPPHMYHGDLGAEDDKDFACNWSTWNRANWGTKWGAYQSTCGLTDDGMAFIKFQTAWSVPYPIIAAFCNRFQMPFEHRYFDEAPNFWGIEKWGRDRDGEVFHRLSKRADNPDDKSPLSIELTGEDCESES